MLLDPQKDASLLGRLEAALNEAYLETHLAHLDRESAEGRLAIENALFLRYNQATQYAVPWVDRVAPLAGSQVVEIGCGAGASTAAFARRAAHIHGYDIEPAHVDGARIRARILGLKNVSCYAVAPEQLLREIRRRHGAGKVDLVLLYAVLEHCTPVECLETIQTGWALLRPGGHLVVVETPNRLSYLDVHTTFLPFFHLLPAPIALRYYRRTQRQRVIKTLDAAIQVSQQEAEQALVRLGAGISFHDFQIALDIEDLGVLLAADGYESEMLAWFPISLEERLLQTFFLTRDIPAPVGFARFVLNVILRKPTGAMPTEPLIPPASRMPFLVNYADLRVESPVQRTWLSEEFDRLGKVELVVDENHADRLVPANQIAIAQANGYIRLQATGNDPYFYLSPSLDTPLQSAMMKIDIDAPIHSILQVFYVTTDQPDYAESRSVRTPVYRGRNTLLVELPSGVTDRLRIDPGEAPGEYRLYRIELRQQIDQPVSNLLEDQKMKEKPQAKNYWETHPRAGTASQWVKNPMIAEAIYQRISGGKTTKYWLHWLAEDYFADRHFESMLSIGCGIGNHEILLAKLGLVKQIDAFDFSEVSLKIAREEAKKSGVIINFYQDDFNEFNLGKNQKYDLVFCSGSLHHVKEIERLLSIVKNFLKPDGYFIVNEYVGDCYNIYNQHQVELINRLYKCFPASLRSGTIEKFVNPTIQQVFATDPSESVRSKLILPLLDAFFDIDLYQPYGGGILHPLYPLLNHSELSSKEPKSETIVKLLLEFEEILMNLPGGMETDFCLCILRQKKYNKQAIT